MPCRTLPRRACALKARVDGAAVGDRTSQNTVESMRRGGWIRISLLALGLLAASGGPPVGAEPRQATFLKTFRDWNLYVARDDVGKICYIASEPVEKDGNYRRRGATAVVVAKFPDPKLGIQVSVQAGYPYKKKSNVQMTIDKKRYELFTDGENAFAFTAEDDRKIIEAMKRGRRMVVKGTSRKGTYSIDTYSLMGFSAAYRAMLDECKNP